MLLVRIVASIAALIAGLWTLNLARELDTASLAGRAIPAAILLLAAGWALIAAGLVLLSQTGSRTAGVLLTVSGFAWFAAEWNNSSVDSAVVFTAGVVFSTVCPALVGHALLRYDGARLDRLGALAVRVAYFATIVLAGLLPAVFFEPAQQGCADCPANLVARYSEPAVVRVLDGSAVVAGLLWCGLFVIAIGRQIAMSSRGRRRRDAPTLLPGIGYLVMVAIGYLNALSTGALVVNGAARIIWTVQGCLLVLVALGTGWPWLQRRITRARVARLVVDLAAAPPVGGLSGVLSRLLHDPSVRLLFVVDDRVVDSHGGTAKPDPGQASTPILRGGESVAVLTHRPGLLDDPALLSEIADAVRLALDNERLRAQTQAQLVDLRASRTRIVQTADAERRRLERDLHDGAQQRLVALSLAVQLAALRQRDDGAAVARLTQARAEVTAALAELRVLARGIYPRELADEGIAAALETLAENSPTRVVIGGAPGVRFPHAVEAAAYQVVSTCAGSSNAHGVRVRASDNGQDLTVEVETDSPPTDLVWLQDRVGALGGTLLVDRTPQLSRLTAVLPCEW